MAPLRPDGSLYSQVIISAETFAEAAREAAVWLDEHEDSESNVAVVRVEFQLGEDERNPVEGTIRYTQG